MSCGCVPLLTHTYLHTHTHTQFPACILCTYRFQTFGVNAHKCTHTQHSAAQHMFYLVFCHGIPPHSNKKIYHFECEYCAATTLKSEVKTILKKIYESFTWYDKACSRTLAHTHTHKYKHKFSSQAETCRRFREQMLP